MSSETSGRRGSSREPRTRAVIVPSVIFESYTVWCRRWPIVCGTPSAVPNWSCIKTRAAATILSIRPTRWQLIRGNGRPAYTRCSRPVQRVASFPVLLIVFLSQPILFFIILPLRGWPYVYALPRIFAIQLFHCFFLTLYSSEGVFLCYASVPIDSFSLQLIRVCSFLILFGWGG